MPPTPIYSGEEAHDLRSKVPQMMADSEVLKANHVAPTLHQRSVLLRTIVDFARHKGRKIYGGHALNEAFIQKGLPPIYDSKDIVSNDIEFYSPDPISDVRDICNRFYVDRHKYVQGKEAMHSGTYTISVEFSRICDISFMPQKVFDAVPTFKMEFGSDAPLLCVEPSFAIVDHLRILCDPFTSYWKLDKQLPRMLTIQEHFPIDLPKQNVIVESSAVRGRKFSNPNQDLIDKVSVWAASRDAVVAVADRALAFFIKALGGLLASLGLLGSLESVSKDHENIRQITLVSANYAEDLESLNNLLVGAKVECFATEHYPFVDLLGSRTIFRTNGTLNQDKSRGVPFVTLIDARGKALPTVGRSEDGVHVASLTYSIMISLAMRFLAQTENRDTVAHVHGQIASNLIAIRKFASSIPNKPTTSVIDPVNHFRDVNLLYLGTPRSDMSIHMEIADERRLRSPPGSMIWFNYDPKGGNRNNHTKRSGNNGNNGNNDKKSNHQAYFIARCDGHSIVSNRDSVLFMSRSESDVKTMIENKMTESNDEPPISAESPIHEEPLNLI